MFLTLGKLLVAVGLCFEAYTLYHDSTTANTFNNRLGTVLSSCDMIPSEIQGHIKQHLRLVVVGFLAFSALMVVTKTCLTKIPVLLGLIILMINRYYPITAVPSFKDHKFWELLALIGGVIYLMGAEACCASSSSSNRKGEVKATKNVQKSTSTTSLNKKNK